MEESVILSVRSPAGDLIPPGEHHGIRQILKTPPFEMTDTLNESRFIYNSTPQIDLVIACEAEQISSAAVSFVCCIKCLVWRPRLLCDALFTYISKLIR